MVIDLGFIVAVAIAAASAAAGFRWARMRRLHGVCMESWHNWVEYGDGGLICNRCHSRPGAITLERDR